MKNFKRVISAVIALALSASTLVAVSAAKFTDVDSSSNYAEAVDVLTALDIVHGYEDGSFRPDGEITRAEAATMIVGGLNMNADAKAAAGTSKFTDVNEKASWASGYVNVGVAQGFINGMNETTFAPQENVTYAQMCVMLTLITGYGDYAAANGGWPTGYTQMAASAGINKGVAVSNDTPLKRGQVAQMLYNALTTPILGITAYKLDGNTYAKLDGTGGKEYKTILSDKFDAYEVKATVDNLDEAGKVRFTGVTSDYKAAVKGGDYIVNPMPGVIIENGIDLSNYLKQQVKAVLALDANNKRHLLFAKGTEAVETLELAADTYVKTDYVANKQVKFDTTKYTLDSTSVDIYVNGYLYAAGVTPVAPADTTIDNILSKATGTVKLAKTGNASNYNAIFVDSYVIGQVSNVDYKNGVTTVKFSINSANNLGSYKTIEISDNDLDTDATKLSVKLGENEIELKDLAENDVIAVKTKIITGNNTIDASNNKDITVLVSRDTISGKVNAIEDGTDENAFTVGSETYAAVNKATVGLTVGESYNTIYLDAFGRIYSFDDETVEDTKNYAILAKVSDKTDITLVLPNGTKKVYEAKDANVYSEAAAGDLHALEISGTAPTVTINTTPATTEALSTSTVLNCAVEYTLKKGQINSIVPAASVAIPAGSEYKGSVNKIATVGISEATGIINAEGAATYKDYAAMSASDLADGEQYTGAAFGKIGTTTNYSLVILIKAGFDYGANSRFAVVNASGFQTGLDEDGDTVDQLKVLLNGEKTTLNFTSTAKSSFGTVNFGDVFFYVLDSDGLVKSVKKISRTDILTAGSITGAKLGAAGADYNGGKWDFNNLKGTKDIKLAQGILVGAGTNTVRIIDVPTAAADQAVDIDDFSAFALASDCVVYTYDTDKEVADKDKLDEEGSLQVSNFKNWRITDQGTIAPFNASSAIGKIVWNINWSTDPDDPAYAIPKNADLTSRGINAIKLFDTLTYTAKDSTSTSKLVGHTASEEAQYVLALIVNDQVVEIYEIVQ